MHKKTLITIAMVALTLITIVPVFAIKPTGPASTNGVEKGKNDHLYLLEKDPVTWEVVEEVSAWAKLNINAKNGKFVCNAHGLMPDVEYALIAYQDEWPGEGSMLLGTDTAGEDGNVHIKGEIDYDTLPVYQYDTNEDQVDDVTASKIWLVFADDYVHVEEGDDYMDDWNPTGYLFEFDLINKTPIE